MESLDPLTNMANVGKSRRRISILKAPRTSVDFADPELVETPVKVAMPVEKRNSRRVSFAPATDVLLFSKNGSPVRSPLQDLSATINPDNRNPIGVIEKGKQPITDMENLFYAPLQTSQQRKEVSMVSHDAENLYGEKTMMFSAHDADMDVTHSHTVLITNDSDLPDQDGEMLPTCANMDFFMSMDSKKAEPCTLPKISSSSVRHFDPEFEKLLASFSKPSVPKDNSVLHKVEQNVLMRPHDKENQAPTFMTTRRENLTHKTVTISESSNRGVPSEDTQGMEMTDVLTGPIVENATADNPLQCLFPTLDLYRRSEHREPVERNGRRQDIEALKCSLSNPNDEMKTKISVADPKKYGLGVSSLKMGNSLNLNLTQTCPPPDNQLISQNRNVHNVLQSSESDDMDMTRSQTVAIDSKSLYAVTTMTKQQGMSRFSITAPLKNSEDFELDMDFTRCQTGVIEAKDLDWGKPSYTVAAGGSVRVTADNQRDNALNQATDHFEIDNMEITQSQTAAIVSLHGVEPLQMSQDIVKPSTEWNNPSEDDDMEFTTCDTRVFETKDVDVPAKCASMAFMAAFTKASTQNTLQNEFGGEMPESLHSNTLLRSEDAMDGMTSRCEGFEHYNCESETDTVAIDAKNLNTVKTLWNRQKSLAFVATCAKVDDDAEDGYCKDKIQTSAETDSEMEFTRSQTRLIETKHLTFVKPSLKISSGKCFPTLDSNAHLQISMNAVDNSKSSQNVANIFPEADIENDRHTVSFSCDKVTERRDGFERYDCESDDMEMTKSQTVAIDAKNLNLVKTLGNRRKSLAFVATCTKVDDDAEDGYCKDKIQTNAETDSEMEFTRSQTRLIETKHLTFVKPSLKISSGKCFPTLDSNAHLQISMNAVDNSKSSQNVANIFPEVDKENDRHTMSFSCDKVNERRDGFERYNCESDDMEMTKSQTVAIDAKNLNPVKTLGNRRKSLAFAATCAKVDVVAETGYCNDKIQANTDSEMEFTRCQTRQIETKNLTFVKPSLISPANQENERHTLCSEDMELTRSQTVALNCKSTGISNTLFHRGRKSLALLKEKSPGMHVNVFNMSSSESRNPDEMDITRSHTVAIQSKDVHNPDDSSQNYSKVTGPPEGLSPNHSGSRENLGDHLKNRSHGLSAYGDMKLVQNGTIPNELYQEATTLSRSMFSFDGKVSDLNDQLDASQNDVKSIPLSVDKNSPGNANEFSASSESATMQKKDGSDLRQENGSLSCGLESAPCITAAVDDTFSTKSRRMSLVDLQFKLRRMSRLPNEPTERIAVDVCDAPLSQPKSASDGISDKTHLTALQHNPETQTTDNADYTQPEQSAEEQRSCVTAPLLNRRSLSSRLSMGNLLPKLPKIIKPADRNKVSSSCRTPGKEHEYEVATQLSSGMSDDIVDEVLPNISSDEDMSMVTENPQSTNEDGSPLHGRHMQGTLEEEVLELSPGHPSHSQCKRPSPVDSEDMMATDKRRRISSDSTIEMPNQSPEKGKCISTFPLTPAVMTKVIDVSNRSTSQLRSETTFESTLKQSLFESQLEGHMDYTNDFQKNVADERITVSEFFQLLNIDFVIHNPRQSILPGKLASHLGHTPEDLLKNRHINHPKQIVYEAEHKNLTEKVERLKARMKDQARLLHTVNQPLWEELKCFSEDELKRFGLKMKERSNFFRKRSKAQSHEMKEALYSNLLQANLEERQKLRGKMEEADGMLKSLDDCIQELETELAAVEENGSNDSKLTLKSSELGLEKVTMEIADKERQMCEMEVQKKCNMDQVKRLQAEIQDLNCHITLLHRVNEWKVAERRADCDVYSFLYGSLHLEVVFDTGTGEGPDERNILDINFKLELDEEKSECHARLVHTLLSEFTNGQSHWVEKYPSSRCVPKLLHDVSLVVSRCRLLGEEVRLLRTWGSLKFDILDIRCVDTRVHIVFSSLEAEAEFELSLAVTMAYPGSPLQLQDFKNHIGSTSIRRIEEIMLSVSPGKNYLTKIVKAIHAAVHS